MRPMVDRVSSAFRRLSTSLRRPWGGVRGLDEPPVVSGFMPYLGCALPFGRDAPRFLRRCQLRHGDAFTLHLLGRRMTFLLDPRDYTQLFKHGGSLSFLPIAQEISNRAFGYRNVWGSGMTNDMLRESYARYLRPGVMRPLVERTRDELGRRLRAEIAALPGSAAGWREVELYALIERSVFAAGVASLFGDELADELVRQQFGGFDRQFARLVAGVPPRLLGTALKDREALVRRLGRRLPDASAFIEDRYEMLGRYVDDVDAARVQLSMLWASQANTIPAAFWVLAFLLEDAGAVRVVHSEVDAVVEEQGGVARLDSASLGRLRYLDSAVLEALRLCSGATTIRTVVSPVTLELVGGRRCALRPGDNVAIFPYLSHRDPEVFDKPEQFRFDRFWAERGAAQFYKDGERLGFALMPFGGGESMCPGRFLALAEIKLLAAMLLADYELEPGPGQSRPGFDLARSGLGILPPRSEFRVRLRARRA